MSKQRPSGKLWGSKSGVSGLSPPLNNDVWKRNIGNLNMWVQNSWPVCIGRCYRGCVRVFRMSLPTKLTKIAVESLCTALCGSKSRGESNVHRDRKKNMKRGSLNLGSKITARRYVSEQHHVSMEQWHIKSGYLVFIAWWCKSCSRVLWCHLIDSLDQHFGDTSPYGLT